MLTEGRLWLSSPATFNDPFDLSPAMTPWTLDSGFSNEVQRLPPGAWRRTLSVLQAGIYRRAIDLYQQDVRILALSEVPDSLLMWGHYARSHQGFVVGFDTTDPFFSQQGESFSAQLRKVTYRKTRVRISDVVGFHSRHATLKSAEWSYEREWRLVVYMFGRRTRSSRGILVRGPTSIAQIIVGARSSHALRRNLHRLITARHPAATYHAAQFSLRRYAIEMVPPVRRTRSVSRAVRVGSD
jgi:hypothetical protein